MSGKAALFVLVLGLLVVFLNLNIFRRAYYELMQQKGWDTADILMEKVTRTIPPEK